MSSKRSSKRTSKAFEEGAREVLVNAVLGREGRLDLRDALADAYEGPWPALFLERRLEVPRCGEVVGMSVVVEDVGNIVAMFRYLCENIVGKGGAQGAGGWIKIEDGVDDNSLFSLKVCDDMLLGAGFGLEDCLDFGLLRLVCSVCFWSGCFNILGYR